MAAHGGLCPIDWSELLAFGIAAWMDTLTQAVVEWVQQPGDSRGATADSFR